MGLDQVPAACRARAYDYCNATWRSIAAQQSGEVIIARGERLQTGNTVIAPCQSGGQVLGSGPFSGTLLDRLLLTVPAISCSGDLWACSGCGMLNGVWVGGASGYQPWPGSGCIGSGFGFFIPAGEQKELYVQKLEEVWVASEWYSGWPVTYLSEVIVC